MSGTYTFPFLLFRSFPLGLADKKFYLFLDYSLPKILQGRGVPALPRNLSLSTPPTSENTTTSRPNILKPCRNGGAVYQIRREQPDSLRFTYCKRKFRNNSKMRRLDVLSGPTSLANWNTLFLRGSRARPSSRPARWAKALPLPSSRSRGCL